MKMKIKMLNLVNAVDQEEFEAGLLSEHYEVTASSGKSITLPDCFSSDVSRKPPHKGWPESSWSSC